MESFARRCRILGPFIWAISFFGLLWMLDFPKPFDDDLVFIGPALNMAGGGAFSNPLFVRQPTWWNPWFPCLPWETNGAGQLSCTACQPVGSLPECSGGLSERRLFLWPSRGFEAMKKNWPS
jgi:hypothetical protein